MHLSEDLFFIYVQRVIRSQWRGFWKMKEQHFLIEMSLGSDVTLPGVHKGSETKWNTNMIRRKVVFNSVHN